MDKFVQETLIQFFYNTHNEPKDSDQLAFAIFHSVPFMHFLTLRGFNKCIEIILTKENNIFEQDDQTLLWRLSAIMWRGDTSNLHKMYRCAEKKTPENDERNVRQKIR